VIFGVAALLENTPFELYTLIRGGSLIQLQAATRNASTADLIVARDRTVVGRGAIAEVEHNLVHVTPSPAFGWVIAFDVPLCGSAKYSSSVCAFHTMREVRKSTE
jgi:hypothetical protein